MTDAEKIQHGVACITKLREIAAKGSMQDDLEAMRGLFRKMEQLAGFGLANIGAIEMPAEVPPAERAARAAKEKIRELTHG